MLEQLRDASKTWVAAILIGLLVISFAIFGINDIFLGTPSTTLVKVGNAEIDGRDFDNEFLRRAKRERTPEGRPMSPAEARAVGLDRAVMNDMIAESAVLQDADRLGVTASDEMVRDEIRAIPRFLGPTGEIDPAAFAQGLNDLEMTEAQFVARLRNDLTRQQLLQSAMLGAPAPRGVADLLQAIANERRTIEYVLLPADKAGEVPAPDDQALQAFIDADPTPWTAPETRAITVLAVGPTDLMDGIEVSEDDVRAAYEAQKQRYVVLETRELQQIVFPTKEEAEAALKAIEGGKTFEDVATERGLKAEDIALGTITKGDETVPAGAFEVAEGAVTQPLETPFGWMLVRVVKVTAGSSKSFEEVRQELRDELAHEQAIDKVFPFENEIEDARAGGATLEEISKQLDIPLKTFPAIDATGNDGNGKAVEGIPDGEMFLRDVFQTEPGEQSDINQSPEHVFYVIRVDSATPSAVRPLDQIRDQVAAAWTKAEQVKRLKSVADEIAARANQGGLGLADIAKELGVDGKTSEPLARDAGHADLSETLIDALFTTPKGAWLAGNGTTEPLVAIARVAGVVTASAAPDATEELRQYRGEATRDFANEMATAYIDAIVSATPTEVNEELFNSARNRSQ